MDNLLDWILKIRREGIREDKDPRDVDLDWVLEKLFKIPHPSTLHQTLIEKPKVPKGSVVEIIALTCYPASFDTESCEVEFVATESDEPVYESYTMDEVAPVSVVMFIERLLDKAK